MRDLLELYTISRAGWPPINMIFYHALLVACWAYALRRGGAPEKIGATILAIGSFLTVAVISERTVRHRSVEVDVLVVDILCLAAFLVLALRADRFWPLWVAALQMIGTAGHAVKFVDPEIVRRAYALMLVIWAYPMIMLLVAGTWRHQLRLARLGTDKSWSS
jgi:hypothetical protein